MRLTFGLKSEFLEQYEGKPLPVGFDGLGEVVFYRTYSRLKEDGSQESWTDVCDRVINGMYSIQKNHVLESSGIWNEDKAVSSAEEAFDRLWHLKWSPPGRGLYQMGVISYMIALYQRHCRTVDSFPRRTLPKKVDQSSPGSWKCLCLASVLGLTLVVAVL